MSDVATLQTRLVEAESAMHDLQIGKRKVSVSRSGTSLTYSSSPGDVANLRAYIADLKAQISRATGAGRRGIIHNHF